MPEIERERHLDAVTVRGGLRPDAAAGERVRTSAALELKR